MLENLVNGTGGSSQLLKNSLLLGPTMWVGYFINLIETLVSKFPRTVFGYSFL